METTIENCLEKYWPRITNLVGIPNDVRLPDIRVDAFATFLRSGAYYRKHLEVVGLPENWTEDDLIHELVHHAQNLKGTLPETPSYLYYTGLRCLIHHVRTPCEGQARHITRQLLGVRYIFTKEIPDWMRIIINHLSGR